MPLFKGRSKSVAQLSGNAAGNRSRNRAASMPATSRRVPGVMRVVSLDESLHRKDLKHKTSGDGTRMKRSISWNEVQIREYERAVSDNPSVSSGPPIGIGWGYNPELMKFPLESYEDTRPQRRSMREMALPRHVRESLLKKEWGIPQSEIASAVRSTIKVKNQRKSTVNNLGKAEKTEEFFENAGRKFKRGLSLKKNSGKEAEELMKISEEAAKQSTAQAVQKVLESYHDGEEKSPEETPERTVTKKLRDITITEA